MMNAVTDVTMTETPQWIQTDERQYVRVRKDLGEDVFEFAEGMDLNREVYGINSYIVDYKEFTEEQILYYIQPYDYENIERVKEIYGEDEYKCIICECIFESIDFDDTSIYRNIDREEVKALFKEYFDLDLTFDEDEE